MAIESINAKKSTFNYRGSNYTLGNFTQNQGFAAQNNSLNTVNTSMPIPPIFNLKIPNINVSQSTNSNTPEVSSAGGDGDLKQKLIALGYNEQKGLKIAQEVEKGIVGFTGHCAGYVSRAIQRATGSRRYANGCGMADAYNGHGFKEITVSDADLKKLPAGCLLSYGGGVAGYNRKYGHAEITLGDGTAGSDGRTRNIRAGARVLIPV